MNHPIDLTANRDALSSMNMSWDGQENAPQEPANSASEAGVASTPPSNPKKKGSGKKRRPHNRLGHGKSRQKYQFIHRLVDKLRHAEKVPNSSESDQAAGAGLMAEPNRPLAETQHGSESSSPMTFTYPPGSQPLPRYTIRRGIGVGGFGEVYFAVNDAGKEVAIKRIQRNLEIELRGASHCLNLKHPNLVSLYDICRDEDDQSWVIMEYVAGKNLRQILDLSPNGLPTSEVNRWFAAISSGVSHLHSAGLVHRDLKPGNVFDDLGIVKVGDYGLSKFISASHRGGHTESVGTFHYMAPEIGRGQYGREIDIYALGILLYELLTGRVPFDGESSHEIIVKHLTAIPDLKDIDEPYRSVVGKCLEKDPAKRYQTVSEMLQALGLESADVAAGIVPAQLVSAEAAAVKSNQPNEPITPAIVLDEYQSPSPANPHGSASINQPPIVDQEPLARAISSSFADLTNWWKSLDRSPGIKAVLIIVAGFVLLLNTHWLVLILTLTGIFYVPYYVLRQMVLHVRQQPTYAQAQRIANSTAATKPPRPLSRRQWCQQMRTDLRAKRSLSRAAELNTSWIAATLTVVGLALGTGAIGLRNGPVDAVSIAPYSWMGAVVLISSLGILGLGKLWERGEGEGLPRRFVLAGMGAGVGAAAYALNQYLMLPLDQSLVRDIDTTELPQALYNGEIPTAGAMMAHFALLFSVLRWWKPVDPLRRRRLSVWSVAVAVVAEWAVHQVLPIPQPGGMMMAGGIAIAVQMSAPWINRKVTPRPTNYPADQPASNQQPTSARSMA
jgi:serine/threonine protein kinase